MTKIGFDTEEDNIIQTIQAAVKTEILDINDDQFTTRPVELAPRRPLADTTYIHSLTGLTDFIQKSIDSATRKGVFVHVISPIEVAFKHVLDDREDRRYTSVIAKADVPKFSFDQYIGKEDAIIALQARFVDEPSRQALLEKLGNIVADEELRQEDDGVSQIVTTQQGIRRSESAIQNPVLLQPFRTFTEVEQPISPFIVRLKREREQIYVGIFEADGGAWRNAARLSIKEFIETEIGTDLLVPVIA
jgi:hypothetical protein